MMKLIAVLILLAAAGYMLMIMPRMFRRPDCSLFERELFAHRGLHDNSSDAPENSLAAFRKAVDAGFGIEFDVHVTKDHIPVVFHDFRLDRICGKEGIIEEHTYEELQQYRLCGTKETIPALSEVLALVDGKVPLIVEIKSESTDLSSCAIIDQMLRAYRGPYCIESFNPLVLFWYRRNHKEIVRGQLSSDFRKDGNLHGPLYFVIRHLLSNFLTRPDFIAYNFRFYKETGRRLCHSFYRLPAAAWTIRSQEELEAMRGQFEVFIFDSFVPKESK